MKKTANRPVLRALAKQKTLRRKAAAWRRRALRGLAGTLLAAGFFGFASDAHAQTGQTAMNPAGSVAWLEFLVAWPRGSAVSNVSPQITTRVSVTVLPG